MTKPNTGGETRPHVFVNATSAVPKYTVKFKRRDSEILPFNPKLPVADKKKEDLVRFHSLRSGVQLASPPKPIIETSIK